MSYSIGMVSLGCAKNQTDAEIMLGILADKGYTLTGDPAEAEVIIVNTCGFIESAKQESIDTVLEMAEYKKTGKCRLLIMSGCLAQRYASDITTELPEVDAVVGVGDYDRIAEVIERASSYEHIIECTDKNRNAPEGLPRILTTPSYVAYLKIAEGCDNNCTYCAIPLIRGHYRSRRIEDIVAEARDLAASGVKELIVIAQDTTRYGIDLYGEYKLAELLRELERVDGIEWIRVHYFYTEAVTDELIDVMAKSTKICHYIDMPVQHCSDAVLKRMGRRTNKAEIVERIAAIRAAMPDVVIRTSIIAGFPGETEEQFEELCAFLKDIRFDRMGAFAYSEEEGTPAVRLDGLLDEETKERRCAALMELQRGISYENNRARLGSVVEVIAEGYDEESFLYYGRSRGDSIDVDGKVYFAAEDEVFPGNIVRVKILDCDEYDLTGEVIE